MQQVLVDQKDITKISVVDVPTAPLAEGEARLRIESFALTANNVTYAASGFAIGYWQFFPSGQNGLGIVPVWGSAEVSESKAADLAAGTRLYGFFPMAEELVMRPQVDPQGAIEDISPHRADLPPLYNRYTPLRQAPGEGDHLRALLQPLLATSYLLFDWLMDNGCFGARQIIVSSASSKTGLGLTRFLAENTDRSYRIVGLTGPKNRAFVDGLGACDEVLTYDRIEDIQKVPSVYVDMAGNGAVKAALHAHLGAALKHSAAVGISHWDQFKAKQEVPGVKPQFFFAPAQVAKRRAEWGPGVIETEITKAWKRIAEDASDWLTLRQHRGLNAATEVYRQLANGTADPKDGHIVVL